MKLLSISHLLRFVSSLGVAAFLIATSHAAVCQVTSASFAGAVTVVTPPIITGDATIFGITTSEGTFANLTGATASSVIAINSPSSVGTAPATSAGAVTGLSANDAVNNLSSGNFQFTGFPIDNTTRFLIVETTPVASTIGDPATVTLLDSSNNKVGTYTLNLTASQFTTIAAGATSTALATVTFTSYTGSAAQKYGGLTFALSDFSGTGDLSTVTGISIVSGTLDPVVVAVFKGSVSTVTTTTPIASATKSVLFVGNSFTYAPPISSYNSSQVTDLNNSGYGGIPGVFKKMATEGGYPSIAVYCELDGGQTLQYHYENKASLIGQSWDWVVMQELSTRPLTSYSGGNVAAFRTAVQNLKQLVVSKNANVNLLLYETWARPDLITAGYYKNLRAMQDELYTSYTNAASDFTFSGCVLVGEAFLKAISYGYADDITTTPVEGPIDLWYTDNYHPSAHGAYLSAAMFYSTILGGDPRTLPTGSGSSANDIGITATNATYLQAVAYRMTHPITLVSAASRMAHNGVNYDLPLPIAGAEAIEPRSTSNGLQLVFTFDNTVSSAIATVATGSATVSSITYSGEVVTVNLTSVSDVQNLTVTLSSLNNTDQSGSVSVGVLSGDVNGDGVVNILDMGLCRLHSGQTTDSSNYIYDVGTSGSVNIISLGKIKQNSGHVLP